MLDEFRAVNGGDQELATRAWRASAVVHRAMEPAFEDGAINLAEVGGGGFFLDAYNDAVGMEEILDGRAFAQEFGIGSDAEMNIAVAAVSGKRAA